MRHVPASAGLGRSEVTLTVIDEAVAIRRELALARLDAISPDVAMVVDNQ
jgi:hypothetical protein